MDVMLQHHNAKHVCDIPDGLRELCADISREVIRSQPEDIYCFIADYLDALMITRENAKIALKLVQNVTLRSEHIVEILAGSGLRLEEIAAAAPRLQKAFRVYLEAVEAEKNECGCDDSSEIDAESEISICEILKETGTTYHAAWRAATKIQALFRGHYERMTLAECRGEVQWQRAAMNTMEILRKLGVTQSEASQAAIIIQSVYRGYYTRKNLRLRKELQEERDLVDPTSDWLGTMFENTGLTLEKANEAATVIQTTFRRYQTRKSDETERRVSGDHEPTVVMTSASRELQQRRSKAPSSDDDSLSDGKGVRFRSHVMVSVSGTLIPADSDNDLGDEMSQFFSSMRSVERSQLDSLDEDKDEDDAVAEEEDAHEINEEDDGVSDE